MSEEIPFTYSGSHLLNVPVLLNNEVPSRFILDTGIGINLISETLAQKLKCNYLGESFTGKRMSGQEVSIPLVTIPLLSFGDLQGENVIAGTFDPSSLLPPEMSEIQGFLSLTFFQETLFAVDYRRGKILLGRNQIQASNNTALHVIPVKLERKGVSLSMFLELTLPNERKANVEVDTGSDWLILNSEFMPEFGIEPGSPFVKKASGFDETGNEYARYFARLNGKVTLLRDQKIFQNNPDVMFQRIIYDGLIGHSFLKRYKVWYDVKNSTMIFFEEVP